MMHFFTFEDSKKEKSEKKKSGKSEVEEKKVRNMVDVGWGTATSHAVDR